MPRFVNSYQTRMGSAYHVEPIVNAIKKAFIQDYIQNKNLKVNPIENNHAVYVLGNTVSEAEIPLFTHPISILNYHGENYLCTDMRFFVKKDTPTDIVEKNIKNLTEYNFAKSRSILELIWMSDGVDKIKNTLSFAGVVFSNWLSETIAKTYALDFKDQTTLNIITSFYYQSLFLDKVVFDDDDKQRMAVHTMKATNSPSNVILPIFDKIEKINSVDDYCEAVVRILENVRLEKFNLAVLLTIVKNSWYGTNAKDIIAVALEHPPTWISIVYTALTERTFKTSMVYRVAERFGKRGASDEFQKTYSQFIKENLNQEQDRFAHI